jgi:hypothetical protein
VGIRSLKTEAGKGSKKHKKDSRKVGKLFLKGFLTVFLAITIILGMAIIRYGKHHFFEAPIVQQEDFLSGSYEISPQGAFVVPFDQRMNKASVKEAIKIQPVKNGEWIWDGRILKIKPKKALETGEKYILSIDRSAKNLFGQQLQKAYELHYEVGLDPQIRAIYPEADLIHEGEHLTILFSHAMISRDELGQAQRQGFFRIDPVQDGEWKWYNEKTLSFHPKNDWDSSTKYQLIASDQIYTNDGAEIKKPLARNFQTERFTILERDEKKSLEISESFILAFNQEPDMTSLRELVQVLDENGKIIKTSLILMEDMKSTKISKQGGLWDYDHQYQVIVPEGLMPKKGNLSLEKEGEQSFSTESFFITQRAGNGSHFYNAEKKEIRFETKKEIALDELKNRISISPAYSWSLKKDKEEFVVSLSDNSQKRESIKIIYKENILEEGTLPREILFVPAPQLLFDSSETEQHFCVFSNNALYPNSALLKKGRRERSISKIQEDKEGNCEGEAEYIYAFDKKFFAPNEEHVVEMKLNDVYGNIHRSEEKILTQNIKTDDRTLSRESSLFYHNVQSDEDLHFNYYSENIENVLITLCKIDAESALKIETSFEQRWFSFDPTPEKCLKFERKEETLAMDWGKKKKHKVSVSDYIDEIESGIYYFHILAPGYYSNQGDPIETNVALQFSDWSVLSKRGKSSLLWLFDHNQNKPVKDAQVSFATNDGLILETINSDQNGIILLPDTDLKYDFVMARKGKEELLLSVFSQEGIEPSRYGVPIDIRDQKYQHQFYLEDPSQHDENFQGLFILKASENGELVSPKASQGVVVLYDQEEKKLWRSFESFDDFGSLSFSLPSRLMITGGVYQLEVCLGLHQGLCQGESFWTFFDPSKRPKNSNHSKEVIVDKNQEERIIQLGNTTQVKVGQEVSLLLQNLIPGVPLLLSVERDAVYWHEILQADETSMKTSFTVTQDMLPELIISVSQFAKDELKHDMKTLAVERSEKSILFANKPGLDEVPLYQDSNRRSIDELSSHTFTLFGSGKGLEAKALQAFYPRLGTSVISASNVPYKLLDMSGENYQLLSPQRIQDAVIINGYLLGEDDERNLNAMNYVVAHDLEGNFANLLYGEVQYDESLEIATSFPDFLRASDKLIYSAEVFNNTDYTKNLQIINSSPHMRFPNGASMFLGLPSQQIRTISVPAELSPSVISKSTSISMSIAEQGTILSSTSIALPLVKDAGPIARKIIFTSQSNALEVEIALPLSNTGEWSISTVISPTPVVFVLENLRSLLAKKTLDLEEMVTKMSLALDFEELIDTKGEETSLDLENEIAYLKDLQLSNGGWGHFGKIVESDPLLSSSISKSLALMINAEQEIPEEVIKNLKKYLKNDLDERSNERVRAEQSAAEIGTRESFEELFILHGLSSLSASGVSYANNWYFHRESLSTESLLLLLLVFEDYRDAGVDGSLFKIEELIQTLKQKSSTSTGKAWLTASSEMNEMVNDFVITSWYLEALVRQASSHSDIPPVINWLIQQKNLPKNQSVYRQAAYLQAMGAYLKIFQAQINSPEITLESMSKSISYDLDLGEKSQAFSLHELILIDEESEEKSLRITSEQAQPLFVEVIAQSKEQQRFAAEKGIAVFHDFSGELAQVGEEISGEIIIISDTERERVVVVQPQISGAVPINQESSESWTILNSGLHEKWYVIAKLPEGETRIPFTWKAEKEGIYQVPPVYTYVSRSPEVYGTSQRELVEIR